MARPNRSDVHLPLEEEARIEEETRDHFDALAPKRHSKPQRSDYSSQYTDLCDRNDTIPELTKFQDLESHPEKLIYNGSKVAEEYVETEYYKDLNEIDKEHHTTGTGFIKTEKPSESYFSVAPDTDDSSCRTSCKGNPATNEWIPTVDHVFTSSDKPHRSDG